MWKSLTILMGPPGSGKTTLGRLIESHVEDAIFISIGEYIRTVLGLKPPFIGLDREVVIAGIRKQFSVSDCNHLILDCNPYPPEMWQALERLFPYFACIRFFTLHASPQLLLTRMSARSRVDNTDFPDEKRLKYYLDFVMPAIKKVGDAYGFTRIINETTEDMKVNSEKIMSLYE